jgi:hypothetical protein
VPFTIDPRREGVPAFIEISQATFGFHKKSLLGNTSSGAALNAFKAVFTILKHLGFSPVIILARHIGVQCHKAMIAADAFNIGNVVSAILCKTGFGRKEFFGDRGSDHRKTGRTQY